MLLLEAKDLRKTFGDRTVVKGVDLRIEEAEIVGLLGRNGAGKTTSFRMIMGMIEPDSGQVLLRGRDISKMPMYRRARAGMGYLSQEPSIFGGLSCEKNLLAILETQPGMTRAQRKKSIDSAAAAWILQAALDALPEPEPRSTAFAVTPLPPVD